MQTFIDFNSTITWENLLAKLDKSNYQIQKWDEQKLSQIPTNLIKQEPCDLNWLDSSANARGSNSNNRTTNPNRSNNSSRFNGTCNYCRRVGHKEAECRTKAREQQQDNASFINSNDNNDNNGKPNRNNFSNNNNSGRPNTYNNNNSSRNNNNNNNINYRQQSQQSSGQQNQQQSQQTNTHVLELNNDTLPSNANIEFPFYAHTATVEMNSASKQITPTPLLFAAVHLRLFKQEPRIVKALLDSGSSHSFISPSIMSQSQLQIASDKNNRLSERHNFIITSATGIAKSACSIRTAEIEICSWKGEHSFIISGAVTKHEMIIGRDFFKQNKVIVNHANDSITIDEMQININTICSISTKPTFDDKEYFNTNEIDYSQLILTTFRELQKDIAEYKTASDKIIKAFI